MTSLNPRRLAGRVKRRILILIHGRGRALVQKIHFATLPKAKPEPNDGLPRLLIDVSITDRLPYQTGIQRVVRRTTEALTDHAVTPGIEPRYRVQPFVCHGKELYAAPDFTATRTGKRQLRRRPLREINAEDTVLMLDANWADYEHISEQFAPIHTSNGGGGQVATVVYDLVPLLHPQVCSADVLAQFRNWLHQVVANSDVIVCISETVAEELTTYLATNDVERRPGQQITSFQLGSDVAVTTVSGTSEGSSARSQLVEFLNSPRKTILMVGTIEPRKRHELALDAMERVWTQNENCQLLFIGRQGWKVDEFAARLEDHPQAGNRLLWLQNGTDAEVEFAYRKSAALLFPSLYEGYGLPVVEAMRENLPVIASDLAVLREIVGNYATYIPVDDGHALEGAINLHLNADKPLIPAKLDRAHVSWNESGQQMWKQLFAERTESESPRSANG